MNQTLDFVICSVQFVFCLIGLAANIVICWTIIRHRKSVFASSFYLLVLALAVPDCVHLSTELLCAYPATFYGLDRIPKWFLNSCGYFADSSFWGIAPLMLVIAINRYTAVCHIDIYKFLFTRTRVICILVFCCAFAFCIPSIMYACNCYYDFKQAWLFDCHDFENKTGMGQEGCQLFALTFNAIICNSICMGVAIMYTLTFVQHKRIQKRVGNSLATQEDASRKKKEFKLMVQFAIISSVLLIYQVVFWILNYANADEWGQVVLNVFVNLNSCVSPFMYLGFSSEIRSRLPWRKQATTWVSTIVDGETRIKVSDLRSVAVSTQPLSNVND